MYFTSILSYLKTKSMNQYLGICHLDLSSQVKEEMETAYSFNFLPNNNYINDYYLQHLYLTTHQILW